MEVKILFNPMMCLGYRHFIHHEYSLMRREPKPTQQNYPKLLFL